MLHRQPLVLSMLTLVLSAFADRGAVKPPPAVKRVYAETILEPRSTAPIMLRLSATADEVYKAICKQAGISVEFAPNWEPKKLWINLYGTTLRDALDLTARSTQTAWRVVSPKAIRVESLRLPRKHPPLCWDQTTVCQ